MRPNALPFTLIALLIFTAGYAQQSTIYTHENKDYQDALELFNNKQYQAAQGIFRKVQKENPDAETRANAGYYTALTAIRLNQMGADGMMEDFVTRYPTSVKRNSAFMDVADHYFSQGKYPMALRWYNKSEEAGMVSGNKESFYFKKGYALFASRKYGDARTYLERVSASPQYGSQAKYYIGYMAYQSEDYREANQYFDQVSANPELNRNMAYYQADMNFKLGDFDKAIAQAKEQLPRADRKERSQLNKIIGESYFNKGNYAQALPYLREYKGSQGRWSNTDYYQLGYVYYKQGMYTQAIAEFNKITDGANGVAQNAYYHLGECYLHTGKKQEALNAFRNASAMNFDLQIVRDAWLHYARLSYELGNPYQSVPEVLMTYLEKFPDSGNSEEIRALLVDSYLTSGNFEAALTHLEKNRSYSDKETYRKVSFYYGIELFQQGNYEEAGTRFEKALDGRGTSEIEARATFWKAETDYLLGNYEQAVSGFRTFKQYPSASGTEEFGYVDYHLGYAGFKQKNYVLAAASFAAWLESAGEPSRRKDAFLRLGDSRFANREYWPAMEAYNEVIALGGEGSDYARYQKAVSYGYVGREDQKISTLREFIDHPMPSALKDDALYELGNTCVNAGREEEGIAAYQRLVRDFRMSSLVPRAILKEGLVYYNKGDNTKALERLRTVAASYERTEEAVEAVAAAKLIYVDEGRVNEYAAWVRTMDYIDVSNEELDNAAFASAERQFAEDRYPQAIKAFKLYLSQFPNGLHQLRSAYYLARAYDNTGESEAALPYYEQVIRGGSTADLEESLLRAADIILKSKDFRRAMPYLEQLQQRAEYPENRRFAITNLMKAHYELGDATKAMDLAATILGSSEYDERIKADAWAVMARTAMETGKKDKAREAYKTLESLATGALAAEALYHDALFKHQDQQFEASNTSVQQLVSKYSAYREFGAKGLVLMARNFYALDDLFQATYILENVVENFSEFAEVTEEAEAELQKIRTVEAQRNSSAAPQQK